MFGPPARDLQSAGLQHVHSTVAGRRRRPESSSRWPRLLDQALDVGVAAVALHVELLEGWGGRKCGNNYRNHRWRRQNEAQESLMFTERAGRTQRGQNVCLCSVCRATWCHPTSGELQQPINSSIICTHHFKDQHVKAIRFQPVTCEYFLVSFLLCGRKRNILHQDTWGRNTDTNRSIKTIICYEIIMSWP